jgi:nucleoside-diphosphate-sugar epimerase
MQKEIFYDAISNNVPAIINISSQSVYGKNPNIPWSEDADLMPNDSYGMAKASAEILLDGIAKGSATVVTNLRLSSIMLNARFVNVFVQNAIEGNPITIIGGTQKVSFMDIRDAVDGIIALVNVPISNWEKVYNLGTGKQNSIVEIAEIVKDVAKLYLKHNVSINIEKKEIPINSCMDINKFFSLTNWKAHYDIKDMIKSQFEYLLDNKQEANNSFSTRYPFTYKWQ